MRNITVGQYIAVRLDLVVLILSSHTCETLRDFSTAVRIAYQIWSARADTKLRVSIRSSWETLCIETKINGIVGWGMVWALRLWQTRPPGKRRTSGLLTSQVLPTLCVKRRLPVVYLLSRYMKIGVHFAPPSLSKTYSEIQNHSWNMLSPSILSQNRIHFYLAETKCLSINNTF